MSVSCLICNNQLKNKNCLRTHISKYNPKRESFDVMGQCGKEEELIANKNCNHLKCQTETNDVVQRELDSLDKELQEESSICPSKMSSENVSSMSNGFKGSQVPNNLKRSSRKRKYDDASKEFTMTKPIPPPRFQQQVKRASTASTRFVENSYICNRITSIMSDLQNYESRLWRINRKMVLLQQILMRTQR